ncbi:hypothetical protein BH09SUM1_BH09SUM1_07660 [soil metagenome]
MRIPGLRSTLLLAILIAAVFVAGLLIPMIARSAAAEKYHRCVDRMEKVERDGIRQYLMNLSVAPLPDDYSNRGAEFRKGIIRFYRIDPEQCRWDEGYVLRHLFRMADEDFAKLMMDPYLPSQNYGYAYDASSLESFFLIGVGPDEKGDIDPKLFDSRRADLGFGPLFPDRFYDPTNGAYSGGDMTVPSFPEIYARRASMHGFFSVP